MAVFGVGLPQLPFSLHFSVERLTWEDSELCSSRYHISKLQPDDFEISADKELLSKSKPPSSSGDLWVDGGWRLECAGTTKEADCTVIST